jgi:hypothetical protein
MAEVVLTSIYGGSHLNGNLAVTLEGLIDHFKVSASRYKPAQKITFPHPDSCFFCERLRFTI